MATTIGRLDNQEDLELAKAAQRHIVNALDQSLPVNIAIIAHGTDKPLASSPLRLPPKALHLLADLLGALAEGKAVTVVPKERDVTTQEAAIFLNISRPYLIRLLEEGKIAHHKVGTHRRIRFDDLLRYKEAREKKSSDALQELINQAQELGLGY